MILPETPGIRAIVFDLDGTLVDSAPDLQNAVNKVLEEKARRPLTTIEVQHMVGDGVLKLIERAFMATGVPAPVEELPVIACRFLDFYEGHDADLTRPYPGVRETLALLGDEGLVMGVCTNKPQGATDSVLEKLGLRQHFKAVVGGDAVHGPRKPDPQHLLATMQGMGAGLAETVMVGDHPNDVHCARGAGIPVVAVTYGYSRRPIREAKPDILIDTFADLPRALQEFA
jgi:phosphoglycolate phosphatase